MYEQNKSIHEEELKQKAMEHDMSGLQDVDLKGVGQAVEESAASACQKIAEGVAEGYKKIEKGVVAGYKKLEEGVVEGFEKISDKFIEKIFAREGETVEGAKKRLTGEKMEENQ